LYGQQGLGQAWRVQNYKATQSHMNKKIRQHV